MFQLLMRDGTTQIDLVDSQWEQVDRERGLIFRITRVGTIGNESVEVIGVLSATPTKQRAATGALDPLTRRIIVEDIWYKPVAERRLSQGVVSAMEELLSILGDRSSHHALIGTTWKSRSYSFDGELVTAVISEVTGCDPDGDPRVRVDLFDHAGAAIKADAGYIRQGDAVMMTGAGSFHFAGESIARQTKLNGTRMNKGAALVIEGKKYLIKVEDGVASLDPVPYPTPTQGQRWLLGDVEMIVTDEGHSLFDPVTGTSTPVNPEEIGGILIIKDGY